jgi:hypothetical protein
MPLSDADVGLSTPMSDADVGLAAPPQGFLQGVVSAAQRIYPGFLSTQQAAAQRTTPVIEAQAPNLLGPATADELGNVGYKDPSGQFVPTDTNKHVVLLDPADNTPKVYARTEKTAAGAAESAGHMLSTMFGPGNIGISRAAPAAVQAAERLGVDVPQAIASERPLTQFSGQVVARAPGGGPLQEAIPRSIEQLGGKVSEAAELAGGAVSPARAGEGFGQAVESGFKPGGPIKSEVERAYSAVGRLVDPNRTQPLNATREAVQAIATERASGALPGAGKAADFVEEAINRPGLTYDGIKRLRTSLGEMLESGRLPEGVSEGELRRIYGALSDDLRTAVIDAGGPRAAVAFERANRLAAGVADWRDQLRKILGPTTRSGEGIYEAVARMAGQGASADQQGLLAARAAVPREVWQDIASTTISRLGRNRAGEFSPALFIRDYNRLSDVGKRTLFGTVGSGNVIPFLDDIAQISERFVQAGKLANVSGTAGHQAFYTALTSIFGGLAATPVLGPAALLAPAAAIGGIVGNNVMARVLATPATAASMARWARVYQAVAERPTPAGIATFQRVSGELANTINGAFGTKLAPADIMRSTVQGPSTGKAGENQNRVPRPEGQ